MKVSSESLRSNVLKGKYECPRKSSSVYVRRLKIEGDTVYLKLKAPRVDLYQYEVQASYQTNNKDFFDGIVEEKKSDKQTLQKRSCINSFTA